MSYFKYRGGNFERDLKALMEDYFWGSEISSLNDPYEFMVEHEFYRPQFDLILQIFSNNTKVKSDFDKVHKQFNSLVLKAKEAGIFSLSKNYSDELLWAHYADSHKGFCIEFDSDLLKRNLNKNFYNFLEVKYSEVIPKIEIEDFLNLKSDSENFLQKLISTKSKRWEYEEEVRFVMDQPGRHHYDFRAVKAIYFGLRMEDAQKKILMKCLEGRGIKYYQMELENKSYKLNPKPVEDLFSNAPKYLYKVAPAMDDSVSENEVKESYKHLIPYLYKAVEVAQREPYSSEVWYAAFSTYEGTPENPKIFVQCKKTNQEFSNFYYSLEEIEEEYSKIEDLQKT